jgi:hypothetical protein
MTPIPYKPLDTHFVDLASPQSRAYWAARLGCTEHQLLDAVALVGPSVAKLIVHLSPGKAG